MLENLSKSGKRLPNTSHAATRTSFCKKVWGGTDVASERRAAVCMTRSFVSVSVMMETSAGSLYFVGYEKLRSNGSLKRETRAPADHIGDRAVTLLRPQRCFP